VSQRNPTNPDLHREPAL